MVRRCMLGLGLDDDVFILVIKVGNELCRLYVRFTIKKYVLNKINEKFGFFTIFYMIQLKNLIFCSKIWKSVSAYIALYSTMYLFSRWKGIFYQRSERLTPPGIMGLLIEGSPYAQ